MMRQSAPQISAAHDFAIAQSGPRKWDHFSRIGGATFSAGAGGSAG
jgi:hypothetical protein